MFYDRRVILFPQGQPKASEQQNTCLQFAMWCGGDVQRVIDAPSSSVQVFAKYVSRIASIRDGNDLALVVLTKTSPLALSVVQSRAELQNALPALRGARWLIFHDPSMDPFFEEAASQQGRLSGALKDAPLWIDSESEPYLVVSARVGDRERLDSSLRELDDAIERAVKETRR